MNLDAVRYRPTGLAAILCLALAATTVAATADDATSLSLTDAIRRGLETGEESRIASSRVTEAEEQLRVARSALLPDVAAQLTYARTIRTPFDMSAFPLPPGVSLPFGQKNTWSGGLNINQLVYTGGQVTGGIRIARELVSSAVAQSAEDRSRLELEIVESYYGTVLADRAAAIVEATVTQIGAQLDHVKLLHEAGNASDLEVLRVSVARENLEPERVQSANARALAMLNLKRLVNIDPGVEVHLSDGLGAGQFARVATRDVDVLVSRAIERRAALEAARRGLAVFEEQARLADAAFRPQVALSLHFGGQAHPGTVLAGFDDFNDDWSAAFAVQMPVWDAGRRRALAAAARERLAQTRLQYDQLRELVSLEVLHQRGELERAAVLMEARGETTRQSERVYELTNLSYLNGFSTHLMLDDARLALNQARLNEAQALYDYLLALARLRFAAGVPISPDWPSVTTGPAPTPTSTPTSIPTSRESR